MNQPIESRTLLSKDIFGSTIVECAQQNESIVVLDADLMRCFGTGDFKKRFPERHFNFGIAEQNCVAAAGGLGISGKNVFCASFANFITKRACDQVSISVAYNEANVKVCGLYAGLTAEKNGGTHIGVEDVAIMRCTPNIRVVEPGDTYELEVITRMLAGYMGPVYFRQPKIYMKNLLKDVKTFEFGKSVEVHHGSSITIIACGIMLGIAHDAVLVLQSQGIEARLINMSSIKPIDEEAIVRAATETGGIITCENHSIIGGLGGAVAEVLADHGIGIRVKRMGIPDRFAITASLEDQLRLNGLTSADIMNTVKQILKAD